MSECPVDQPTDEVLRPSPLPAGRSPLTPAASAVAQRGDDYVLAAIRDARSRAAEDAAADTPAGGPDARPAASEDAGPDARPGASDDAVADIPDARLASSEDAGPDARLAASEDAGPDARPGGSDDAVADWTPDWAGARTPRPVVGMCWPVAGTYWALVGTFRPVVGMCWAVVGSPWAAGTFWPVARTC